MLRPGEAVKTVQTFFDAYLVRRDMTRTTACLAERIQWIGTGKSKLVAGLDNVQKALETEFAQTPAGYTIHYDRTMESAVSDLCAVALLTGRIVPAGEEGAAPLDIRVTATCVEEEDGVCRIASIHASTASDRQEEGAFFPASCLSRTELEKQLGPKSLDILGRSIPGGMMGGYLEPGYPLYFVNDLMLNHLGYTYEEFVRAIDGKVANCMHPEDRERVDRTVERAFRQERDYEVQYRMLKKDGSYIWVNDIGKKGLSEDGRGVYISVIRDITAEMEAKSSLERQAAEQESQATRYDRLFQSVLCGIVQYRLSGKAVVFKNANREAIRIFGYTPETFWAKRDWELPDLIAEEDRARVLAAVDMLEGVGDKGSYEYRLMQRDGTPCWIIGSAEIILDADGEEVVQSVFLDIDNQKKAELRSRLLAQQVEASGEILRLALEHTTTCEFYYYPQEGVCEIPERTRGYYHTRPRYENMPWSFAAEKVREEDRPAFYDMYGQLDRGARTASVEFRILGAPLWCRETLTVIQSGGDGAPRFVVGILEDITRQKEMEEALQEARTRDSLTGIYNKETGERLVRDYLLRKPPDEKAVLMLLDMDDFGRINREEGNVFADAILQEVADIIRAEAGEDGIQVRLGGDEFMLFLKHKGKAEATVVGPRIAELVRNIFVSTEKDIQISVSIGMCSTEVVEEYEALYRCAESTLKYVKEHGKGTAACYLDTSNELGVFLTQLYREEHPVNAIDREVSRSEEDLVSFALELLGKSKNLDDAVFLLLARIGKSCGFDRVNIIEASRAFLTYRFSYQWARNRADLQLGQDFYVSAEDFDICDAMYDEDGLADRNVRDGISHIASCLHAGIWNYGEYVGSMSFEVDQEGYQWSPRERKLLKELVKIVPSFVMKAKADAVSQAKTDFLSRMSHEIRTPMNAISGMTTIAKSVLDDRQRAMDCLEKIESANAYLLGLINDILDMSRIESGKMELNYEPMDLAAQLSGLEALLRPQAAEKGLELRVQNEYTENRPLLADGLRLNQVLVNIIGNAIKFTGAGGSVFVSVTPERGGEAEKRALRFSVADTGIGIEPAALERIFNPFEQAEKSTAARHGGTGLGLSISSRLVQMMGGSLEARSQVGVGSEFSFTLTLGCAAVGEVPSPEVERPSKQLDFRGLRVLLAEDNELNREIAQTILEMNGFTVECASDGSLALERYSQEEPRHFDAILMDIRMPVMDGLEATRRIRTSGRPDARSIPIIALTANAFDEDSKKSMESGMNGHLSKPIQVEQMLELLGACLERQAQGGAT